MYVVYSDFMCELKELISNNELSLLIISHSFLCYDIF